MLRTETELHHGGMEPHHYRSGTMCHRTLQQTARISELGGAQCRVQIICNAIQHHF